METTSYRNSQKTRDRAVESVKLPPQSVDAEQSLLGGLLIDNQTWDQVADRVRESDFYQYGHRLIFRAIEQLVKHRKPLDVLTVSDALKNVNALEEAGGEMYLFELAKNTPSAANVIAYADIVRERSVLRQLISTSQHIADSAFNTEGRTSIELLDDAERKIFKIAEQNAREGGPTNIKTYLTESMELIHELSQSDNLITGLATGYTDLDHLTSGLQPADLIVIAGRPSMGKTAFAMNIAESAAIKSDKPVLIFSMEMPGSAIAMRLLSSLGRIDQLRIRTGKLKDEDWPRINSAVNMLSDAKLFIDDTPALSPIEVRARARRLARQEGQLGLIVVDYLQLMTMPGRSENRTMEISEISRSLKALAKELNVPVIAASQLNRSLEQRTDKRPVMSDLRESGAIEQDADLIAFIYRDEVYHPDSNEKGIAEIIIAKQRNGPIGKIKLTFLGQFTRFENFSARG